MHDMRNALTMEDEGAGFCTAEGGAAEVRLGALWSSGFIAGNNSTCMKPPGFRPNSTEWY